MKGSMSSHNSSGRSAAGIGDSSWIEGYTWCRSRRSRDGGFVRGTKEVDMFARNVSINLRPNTLSEFLKTMENEIVPLLRKQKGFQDEMTLSVPGGIEVVAVSFWDRKENVQGYDSSVILRC
jgi:hypothetical protein